MKKFKYVILVLILAFCFFINIDDVKAEESLTCYYNYTDTFTKHSGRSAINNTSKSTIVMQIAYNSDKIPTPTFAARIVDASKVNFAGGNNGYTEAFNLKDYQPLRCLNTDDLCFVGFNNINIRQLRDNNDKLVCPKIYLFTQITKSSKGVALGTYEVSLSPDSSTVFGQNYDTIITINPDSKYSSIKNDENSSSANEVATSCQYKYENYLDGGVLVSGTVGFQILKDGSVDKLVASGGLSNETLKWNDDKITNLTCPDYLNFEGPNIFDETIYIKSSNTASDADATYEGALNNATDNSKFITYVRYGASRGQKIYIKKEGSSYSAQYSQNGSSLQNISLTVPSDVASKFDTSNPDNYPVYIIETTGGNYTFTDETPENQTGKTIYILSSKLNELQGFGEEEIYATCEELFGGGFLSFLNNTVFRVIYIGVPILLIVLTTFDFAKVVFNDDKEGIQNAGKKFGKRIAVAVLIYLIPTILIFLGNTIGSDSEVESCARWFKNAAIDTTN